MAKKKEVKRMITFKGDDVSLIDRWIKAHKASKGTTPSTSTVLELVMTHSNKYLLDQIDVMNEEAAEKAKV